MRLIDADKLLRKQYEIYVPEDPEAWFSQAFTHKVVSIEDIKKATTIEAEPVKHAKWVDVQDFGTGNCYGYCSNCKTMHRANNPTALKMEYRHCRWCGAKMDGGAENAK